MHNEIISASYHGLVEKLCSPVPWVLTALIRTPLCRQKSIFIQITEKFRYVCEMHRKIYCRELQYQMFMNNIIILLLAVRICEISDNRGSDKRGYTVSMTGVDCCCLFVVVVFVVVVFVVVCMIGVTPKLTNDKHLAEYSGGSRGVSEVSIETSFQITNCFELPLFQCS